MGEVSHEPVIRDMAWSYSRIRAFEDCPYRWYLRYIRRLKGKELFFASYGSFMHSLIEAYYTGRMTPAELCDTYLGEFKQRVTGHAPNKKIFSNYFTGGLRYLKGFQPFPYEPLAIEKKVEFNLKGIPFVGYIDFLGKKNSDLFVIDNKSRNLKPRSGQAAPTKTDEELDAYLIQLYLYSISVEQEYGKLPSALCFNCFRSPVFIEEPFSKEAYEQSKEWLVHKVDEITSETEFRPNMEYFKCRHLCEMQDYCEYYALSQKKR